MNGFKVHAYLDGALRFKSRMAHIPSIGDTVRFAGAKYAKVTEVIWCTDEESHAGQRVNIRTESEPPLRPARTALRWKSRAEEAERELCLGDAVLGAVQAGTSGESVSDFLASFGIVREVLDLRARAEAAEAERDKANAKLRVMDSRMKQVHAALLASMSDEQLATSVKAR